MMKIIFLLFLLYLPLLHAKKATLIFQGNDALSEKELYNAINLSKPSFYEFNKEAPSINEKILPIVKQTIKNYYKSKGYYHAQVSSSRDKNTITLRVEEREPLRITEIKTLSVLDAKSQLPFKEGDVFDADKFTQSKKTIQLFYAKESFCNATLDAKALVDIELNSAILSYKVTPNGVCQFGKIEITPSKTVDKEIIESLLFIKEDDTFYLENISKSYKNIYAHAGISSALINTTIDKNSTVDVNVSVVENEKPIRFGSSLGYSSDQGAMVALNVENRNFLGNLKTLGMSAKLTQIYQSLKVNYSMPLKNRDTFGADVEVKNENYQGFKEISTAATLFLAQREMPSDFKESLVFDNTHTYESEDLALFPNGNLFILSPKFGWGYDARDDFLNPTKGYFLNADVMGSLQSFLCAASYTKLTLSGGYILPINASNFLATKATFGNLRLYGGEIPPSYRFFAGGAYSNRAYSYRGLGPKDGHSNPTGFDSMLEVTFEYRFPIYQELRGVVFSDNSAIGDAYLSNSESLYASGGFGLRYTTPIGPISVDFGFDLANPKKQYAFNFHIGELF